MLNKSPAEQIAWNYAFQNLIFGDNDYDDGDIADDDDLVDISIIAYWLETLTSWWW